MNGYELKRKRCSSSKRNNSSNSRCKSSSFRRGMGRMSTSNSSINIRSSKERKRRQERMKETQTNKVTRNKKEASMRNPASITAHCKVNVTRRGQERRRKGGKRGGRGGC